MLKKSDLNKNKSEDKSPAVSNLSKGVTLPLSAIYFMAGLMAVMMFATGYMFAQVNSGKVSGTTATNTAQQQAAQQQGQQQAVRPQAKASLDTIKGLFGKNVIKLGKGDKKLTIVEVSDPSCPYCHVAGGANTEIGKQMGPQFAPGTYVPPVPEMKKLVDQGKADFIWIYTRGHGNGELATKALYCANDQGKFWQAHDLVMSASGYDLLNNQIQNDKSKSGQLADFLASAVDKNQLKNCLDSGKYDSIIQENSSLAQSLGAQGTPNFFLNDKNFEGAYSWNDIKATADSELK